MHALFLTALFMGCSSSPISQYCANEATCSMEDCDLSAEACEELRQGEQDACEADLKSTRNVIATGGGAACTNCVETMDRYFQCASDIPTCTDFVQAATEDCDGEYEEYMEVCTPQVQAECGQEAADGTSGGLGGDLGLDACEQATNRMEAKMANCGIESAGSSGTTSTTEVECTDEDAKGLTCMADCYEAADCPAVDGSDLDGALELGGCMLECLMTTGT
jgi:hypothetical protein